MIGTGASNLAATNRLKVSLERFIGIDGESTPSVLLDYSFFIVNRLQAA
jgi:hypothetical protein